MKDLARLKYSNISRNSQREAKISLIRAKIANSVEEQQQIDIMVTDPINRIIERLGNKPGTSDQFIFPVLNDSMSPFGEIRALQQLVQTINKNMTRICKNLKIDRHYFATVLKRSGASIEFISKSLGHKSKQTTMNYLANFEDDEKRKWANMLLPETDG
jgi:integrase